MELRLMKDINKTPKKSKMSMMMETSKLDYEKLLLKK